SRSITTPRRSDRAGTPPSSNSLRFATSVSEFLRPGAQLHFPAPGRARLPKDVEIVRGNRIRIEHGIGFVRRFNTPGIADHTINDEMRHVDALRRKLAHHTLRQSAERELAHREGRRLRITLDARGGAGEE